MTVVDPETAELAASLIVALRRVTGDAALTFDGDPVRLSGGFWAELVAFRLAHAPDGWPGRLVARVMPDAATAAKETAFQGEVAAQGYATPRIYAAAGPDEGVGGRAFMVMDLAEGRPLLGGLDGVGAVTELPSLLRRIPTTLAAVLADLHGLDARAVERRLDSVGVEIPTVASMLEHMRHGAATYGRHDLTSAATWLQANPPPSERAVICHGDMHPFNVLVDESGVVTVLDWSGALVAPATYDLAVTSLLLSEPPVTAPGSLRPLVRTAGRTLARRFLRAYAQRTQRRADASALAWHQSVVRLRALVEVAGWVAAGSIDRRAGHPWLVIGGALASKLGAVTGVAVRPR